MFGASRSSTPRHLATLITLLPSCQPRVGQQVGGRAVPRSRNVDLVRYVRCRCDELETPAEDGHRGSASRKRTWPGRARGPRWHLATNAVGLRAGQEDPRSGRRRTNRERRRLEHRPPTAGLLHRTPSAAGIPISVHRPRPAVAPRSPRKLPHYQVLRPHRRRQRQVLVGPLRSAPTGSSSTSGSSPTGPRRPWSSTSTARSSSTYGTRWRSPSQCAPTGPQSSRPRCRRRSLPSTNSAAATRTPGVLRGMSSSTRAVERSAQLARMCLPHRLTSIRDHIGGSNPPAARRLACG